jgi:hypothetical protein
MAAKCRYLSTRLHDVTFQKMIVIPLLIINIIHSGVLKMVNQIYSNFLVSSCRDNKLKQKNIRPPFMSLFSLLYVYMMSTVLYTKSISKLQMDIELKQTRVLI